MVLLVGIVGIFFIVYKVVDDMRWSIKRGSGNIVELEYKGKKESTVAASDINDSTLKDHPDTWVVHVKFDGKINKINVSKEKFDTLIIGKKVPVDYYSSAFNNKISIEEIHI